MRALKLAVLKTTQWVLTAMLLLMTLVLFAQIIFRYFFEMPLVWSEEMALVLMIWVTFLGSALLLASHEHISIDFMVELMPPVWQRWLGILAAVLLAAFNIALTYGAWLVVQATASSTSPGMGISMAWHYGGTMLGGLLLSLVSVEELIKRANTPAVASGYTS
ncbi:TRAP transporter small permease [Allopusillimonas soli]|uniref:TRAP transporter small permease protein n=1 Tax=Allopusillimonas soli TaxID=659016 RepID=A0A853F905_9BURK|nr:TRAP transporter small permease [Allopusillimonas soli]NYT36429.1 TRAP transporter small permease [Allopusillimonas soli]TEA74939.1 TRAP transporter small permease [Allopusillimonas soli]